MMNQSQMRKHLFLDLEDTVIEPVLQGWANTSLMNIFRVKSFIDEYRPDHLHLFSFALQSDWDLKGFDSFVRNRLEQSLGMPIEFTPRVDIEITQSCAEELGLHPSTVSFQDLCDFLGKQGSFRLYAKNLFGGQNRAPVEVVLVDDMVVQESFEFPGLGVRGRVLNVAEL